MREQDKLRMETADQDNDKNICKNVSLLDEFKSSMDIFRYIYVIKFNPR